MLDLYSYPGSPRRLRQPGCPDRNGNYGKSSESLHSSGSSNVRAIGTLLLAKAGLRADFNTDDGTVPCTPKSGLKEMTGVASDLIYLNSRIKYHADITQPTIDLGKKMRNIPSDPRCHLLEFIKPCYFSLRALPCKQ